MGESEGDSIGALGAKSSKMLTSEHNDRDASPKVIELYFVDDEHVVQVFTAKASFRTMLPSFQSKNSSGLDQSLEEFGQSGATRS